MATQYFSYTPTDDQDIQLTVGNHSLFIQWRWPVVTQELWDTLTQRLTGMAASDTLVSDDGTFARDYDYLEYYTETVPQNASEREEWLTAQTILPQSFRRLENSTATILSLLDERVALCQGLVEYRDELLTQLIYTCVIVDENGTKSVCPVIPGGWYKNQSDDWAINFQASVTHIAEGQLPIMTMHFEVYDGDA